ETRSAALVERPRRAHVPSDLDARLHLVHVLAAGSPAARAEDLDLVPGNDQAGTGGQAAGNGSRIRFVGRQGSSLERGMGRRGTPRRSRQSPERPPSVARRASTPRSGPLARAAAGASPEPAWAAARDRGSACPAPDP